LTSGKVPHVRVLEVSLQRDCWRESNFKTNRHTASTRIKLQGDVSLSDSAEQIDARNMPTL